MFKKTICVLFFVILISVIISQKEYISLYFLTKNYLDDVKQGQFEQAFQYMDYYDEYEDVKPRISYETAKSTWILRMNDFKNDDLYLYDYKKLYVYKDDGYPYGRVTIFLYEKGKIKKLDCHIHFSKLSKSWKIIGLYGPKHRLLNAMGGYCANETRTQ